MNMGIEPFLVATSVNLICAQRLVRRICTNCKEELEVPSQVLLDAGYTQNELKTTKIYHGKVAAFATRRVQGQTGLYEVMEINDELRELILWRVGVGAKKESCGARNVDAAAQRTGEDGAGNDHDGRSVARNGFVEGKFPGSCYGPRFRIQGSY